MPPPVPPQRYPEIDLLRTLAIVMMIVYHVAYDLHSFHAWDIAVTSGWWLLLGRATATLFIGLTGVSFMLSREKMLRRHTSLKTMTKRWLARALTIFGCAMLITVITYVFDPVTYVRFGVLHLIVAGVLLMPLFSRLGPWNIFLGALVIALGGWIQGSVADTAWLLPFGVMPHEFATIDYFPLFPWFGVTLVGAGLCSLLYLKNSMLKRFWNTRRIGIDSLYRRSKALRAFTVPGKYSLWIYMLHQPILIGLLMLLFN